MEARKALAAAKKDAKTERRKRASLGKKAATLSAEDLERLLVWKRTGTAPPAAPVLEMTIAGGSSSSTAGSSSAASIAGSATTTPTAGGDDDIAGDEITGGSDKDEEEEIEKADEE